MAGARIEVVNRRPRLHQPTERNLTNVVAAGGERIEPERTGGVGRGARLLRAQVDGPAIERPNIAGSRNQIIFNPDFANTNLALPRGARQ